MKRIGLFIIAVLFCCNAACQEIGPYQFSIGTTSKFHKQSARMAENNKLLRFKMKRESRMDGVTQFEQEYEVFIDYGKSPVVYVNDINGMTKTILTKEYVKTVDAANRNLIVYSKKAKDKDFYKVGIENCLSAFKDLEYFFHPLPKSFKTGLPHLLISCADTLLQGREYTKYVGHSGRYYQKNGETGAYDIPYDEMILIFINKATYFIDSVYVTDITENKNKYEAFYRVYSVSNDDISPSFDSIFDFTQEAYVGYSLHDETNPPATIIGTLHKDLTDDVLDFPIVDLNGDTTTIRKEDGFLCLDFWFIGCAPCMKGLEATKNEMDSLGYRTIENAGIKLFYINEYSDNAALIRERTAKYDCEDILYSAKGFNTVYHATPCPYVILISPDKKKIYESSGMQKNEEILKAKQAYESR